MLAMNTLNKNNMAVDINSQSYC